VNVPGEAQLHTPEGQIHTNELECSWDPAEHATWYYVWINRGNENYRKKWIEGVPEYSTGPGLPYGAYTWWIRTWGPDGYGPWSPPKDCTYGVPKPQSPSGVVDGTRLPQLSWTYVEEAVSYEIWMSRNGRKHTVVTTQDPSWTPSSELPGGNYKWWVRIKTADGYGPWSLPMAFTIPTAGPQPVSLLTAAPTGEEGAVEYTWQADEQATWYQLWINRDGQKWFAQWFETGHLVDTVSMPISSHSSGSSYTWWVRGWNVDGYGSWSQPGVVTP